MRTTFGEMHLFNGASQKHDTTFIMNGKEWGSGKTDRQRERERVRGSGVEKGCSMDPKLKYL
jgi:hypothetical protein